MASAIYAAQLCAITKAKLYIVHVNDLVPPAGLYEESSKLLINKLRQQLRDLSTSLDRNVQGDFSYETLLLSGSTTNSIASIANDYELVVMSSKGEADLDRFFLGSTTKYIVEHSKSSIMVVPPNYTFQPIQKIIWALDDTYSSTSGFLHPLPEIARHFNAKIEIFHQDKGKKDKGLKVDLDIFLEDIPYSIHYSFDNDAVLESIQSFWDAEQADMVCMIHHQRSALSKLFNPSKTLNSISRTKVPLLILPYQESGSE